MTIKTVVEQLEEVQAAITKVMSGQSGTWDGKAITMADLSALTAREDMLLKRYKTANSSGLTINAGRINRG